MPRRYLYACIAFHVSSCRPSYLGGYWYLVEVFSHKNIGYYHTSTGPEDTLVTQVLCNEPEAEYQSQSMQVEMGVVVCPIHQSMLFVNRASLVDGRIY